LTLPLLLFWATTRVAPTILFFVEIEITSGLPLLTMTEGKGKRKYFTIMFCIGRIGIQINSGRRVFLPVLLFVNQGSFLTTQKVEESILKLQWGLVLW